jgi:hypothetical protein
MGKHKKGKKRVRREKKNLARSKKGGKWESSDKSIGELLKGVER